MARASGKTFAAAVAAEVPRHQSRGVPKNDVRRRGAPRPGDGREPLSQTRILATALEIADREGLEGLSFRRLADALGVTPMALYNHFDNKQAVLEAILDHVVATYRPTDHDSSTPREFLVRTFSIFRAAMADHPSLVPLTHTWLTAGPGSVSLDLMEACLRVLADAGLEADDAVRAFYALMGFTLGFCAMEAATRVHRKADGGPDEGLERYQRIFEASAIERYPTILRFAPALARGFGDDAYAAELERLVDGLGLGEE
jgi:AcrR family transcriptional regulator